MLSLFKIFFNQKRSFKVFKLKQKFTKFKFFFGRWNRCFCFQENRGGDFKNKTKSIFLASRRKLLKSPGECLGIYFPMMILRPAPRFCPACDAPLLLPAWSPMTAFPAAIVSSSKSRLFSSDGLGPSHGPVHSGCL